MSRAAGSGCCRESAQNEARAGQIRASRGNTHVLLHPALDGVVHSRLREGKWFGQLPVSAARGDGRSAPPRGRRPLSSWMKTRLRTGST